MNLRNIVRSAAAGAFAAALSTSGFAGEHQAPEKLVTNSTSFRIPFEVDDEGGQAISGLAVLYGARDGGPMKELKRTNISAGEFEFSAASDGVWAFDIRMTDQTGVPDPADGPLQPSLLVEVDSTAPQLNLDVVDNRNGTVNVRWHTNDEFAPGSIRLEYAEGTAGEWQPLQVPAAAVGQTTIRSVPGTTIAVQGSIEDRAGNRGSVRRDLITSVPAPATQPTRSPNVSAPGTGLRTPAPPIGQSPFGNSPMVTPPAQAEAQATFPRTVAPRPQLPSQQRPAVINNPINGNQYPAQPTSPQNAPVTTHAMPHNGGFQQNSTLVSAQTSPRNPYPGSNNANSWAPPQHGPAGGSPSVPVPQPGQPGSLLVAGSLFNVDYAVEDVGPSGVSAVQLYITENGGQQWFEYGNDTDMQSPMLVDVQSDGTYGFAIRVRNGVGFIDPPPQPGDRPEIVVTVDQTAPTTQLAVPQVVVQGNAQVHLEWHVQDAAQTMVRLEWANNGSGPWTPVFDWQRDPGRFDWPIQPNSPHSVHFRLLARDAAGNVGSAQTSQPVLIDLKRPKGRMLGVQPASRGVGSY